MLVDRPSKNLNLKKIPQKNVIRPSLKKLELKKNSAKKCYSSVPQKTYIYNVTVSFLIVVLASNRPIMICYTRAVARDLQPPSRRESPSGAILYSSGYR